MNKIFLNSILNSYKSFNLVKQCNHPVYFGNLKKFQMLNIESSQFLKLVKLFKQLVKFFKNFNLRMIKCKSKIFMK